MSVKDKRARAKANKEKAAGNEFSKGLHSAEKIADPWQRCRALADVARWEAPDADVVRVARKAFQAAEEAQEGNDTYRRVAASIVPVSALIMRNKMPAAQNAVLDLLDAAKNIVPPVSQVHALVNLWQATHSEINDEIKRMVLAALLSACQNANSWRAGRAMEYVALTLSDQNTQTAQEIVHAMRASRYKRRAQKALDSENAAAVRLT